MGNDKSTVSRLKEIRAKIREAQVESDKQYPGVDNYLEKALQSIDLALSNLGKILVEKSEES